MTHPCMCLTDFYIIKTFYHSSISPQFNLMRVNWVTSVWLEFCPELLEIWKKEIYTMRGLKDIRV